MDEVDGGWDEVATGEKETIPAPSLHEKAFDLSEADLDEERPEKPEDVDTAVMSRKEIREHIRASRKR